MTQRPPMEQQADEQRRLLEQARDIKRLRAAMDTAETALNTQVVLPVNDTHVQSAGRVRVERFYAMACRWPLLGVVFPVLRRWRGQIWRALRRG